MFNTMWMIDGKSGPMIKKSTVHPVVLSTVDVGKTCNAQLL